MRLLYILRSRHVGMLRFGTFIILVFLAFAIEFHPLPWFYGYPIAFGMFFLLLIVLHYGWTWGFPAALCVYGALIIFDASTWFRVVPSIVFIAATGLLLKKFPDKLIAIAATYWLLAGFPLTYFIYTINTGHQDDLGYLFALNETLLAILSALAADMVLSYSPLRRWLTPVSEQSSFAFNRIVMHLTLIATAVPFFIFILINGYQNKQAVIERATNQLDAQINVVNRNLADWSEQDYRAMRLNGIVQLGQLKYSMQMNTDHRASARLIFKDSNGRAVAAVGMTDALIGKEYDWTTGGIVQAWQYSGFLWMPAIDFPYPSETWRYAYLVREEVVGNGKEAVFLLPLSPYLEQPIHSFISQIQLLLAFIAITMMLTNLLNRLFMNSLTRLVKATTGIPDNIAQADSMNWPHSKISEIRLLTDNFRSVVGHLARIFDHTMQIAYYDHLTGLPNRLSMKEHLTKELEAAAAKEWDVYITVLFIDLDRFKHVNDTLGHDVGDDLLRLVSQRLSENQTEDAFIARISGDEFVIVLRHDEHDEAVRTSEQILDQFRSPFMLHGHMLYLTPSIGMATAPLQGLDIETLMKNADTAMYSVKESGGKGYAIYSEVLNTKISRSMWLENNLHRAIANEEFELYYQPKVWSTTKEISGIEALIRWHHPERGLISPSEFIQVAEETGLIIPLGEWIIRTACEQNVRWQKAGYPPLRVAVNLSARQFHNPNLVGTIQQILDETGMPAHYLELEITEGYLLTNGTYAVEVLERLRAMDIVMSIDDFGTGYSSLSQLKSFPVQAIKIDQSFIQGMDSDRSNDAIVKAVIQLAHSMNLKVIAEGVETLEVEILLQQYGCDEMQGYRFFKPLPAASMEAVLSKAILQNKG